jgi:hypothetical protein
LAGGAGTDEDGDMADTLTIVAQDLYGLEPGDFTAARNARAQQLKPENPALAKLVAALKKPSPAAWVVNLLARENSEDVAALLGIGERMRAAQEQLQRDDLRRLGGERRSAITALTRAGADRAAERGHPPTGSVLSEVEQTLQAGTSDADAAAAVASGLLVKPLRAAGYEPVDLTDAVAVPDLDPWVAPNETSGAAAPRDPVQLADVRRRKEATREAERRERDADAADAEVDALDRRAHRLRLRRTGLDAEIAELREQLEAAESALAAVTDDNAALADDLARARTESERARALADEARAAVEALDAAD